MLTHTCVYLWVEVEDWIMCKYVYMYIVYIMWIYVYVCEYVCLDVYVDIQGIWCEDVCLCICSVCVHM